MASLSLKFCRSFGKASVQQNLIILCCSSMTLSIHIKVFRERGRGTKILCLLFCYAFLGTSVCHDVWIIYFGLYISSWLVCKSCPINAVFLRWKMLYGIIGLLCAKLFGKEWCHLASSGCYGQKCLRLNDGIWHKVH